MSEWNSARLVEVCVDGGIQTGPFGSQLHQSDYSQEGTPVIMPKDIKGGIVDVEGIARVEEKHVERLARHKVERNNIVFPRRGDVAKAAFITEREEGWLCGTGCLKVVLNEVCVSPEFIRYHLALPSSVKWLETHAVGSTMPNVNATILGELPILLPSLTTQRKIAAVLSDYDAAIANCRKQIALLEEAVLRLYREWLGDGKGENWREETAFDFCDIMSGGTPSTKHSEYYEGEIPFFTPADGHNVSCVLDTEKHLSSVGVSHCNSQLFPVGTIMVTARGTVGNVVYNVVPMAMNQSCYAIKPKDGCFNPLLLFVMLQNEMRQIQKAGSSGVFDAIKVETFKLLKLKVPNAELASHCLKVFRPMYSQVERLSRQICFLTEARDRLLPKLMKGEIAV